MHGTRAAACQGARRRTLSAIVLMHVLVGVAFALSALPASVSAAQPAAEKALGRHVLSCDRQGKPEAVYACALERATQAGGGLAPEVVAACRQEIPANVRNPNAQIWNCAKRRQFASQRSPSDWWYQTGNECDARSRSAGHRYEGRVHDCVIDAAIAEQKVTTAQVQACRSSPEGKTAHRMRNCLQKAAGGRSSSTRSAAPIPVATPVAAGNNTDAECRAYLQQQPFAGLRTAADAGDRFLRECRRTNRPPAQVAAEIRDKRRQIEAMDSKLGGQHGVGPPGSHDRLRDRSVGLQMDVGPAAGVTPRDDRGENDLPVAVGDLQAAQVVLVRDTRAVQRIGAFARAMPDVDSRASRHGAGVAGTDEIQRECQWHAPGGGCCLCRSCYGCCCALCLSDSAH